jgi:pimeloyl-ACP methyl ester carboxylesterase
VFSHRRPLRVDRAEAVREHPLTRVALRLSERACVMPRPHFGRMPGFRAGCKAAVGSVRGRTRGLSPGVLEWGDDPGWVSHLALDWDEPRWVRWCERMTSFARLVRFDKRGTGLSDRPPGIPTPDERMEDAQAVMVAAGLEQAHVMGWSEGGPLAVLLATAYPDRVLSLILCGTQATFVRRDDYPFGDPLEEDDSWEEELESTWGTVEAVLMTDPDAEPHFARRQALYNQAAASPAAAVALARANGLLDIRPLLPSIRAPTLVLNRRGDPVGPAAAGRYMADLIPGARFVELDGDEHILWLGDSEALCGEIEGFVTGIRPHTPEPGVVRAILQSDIEGSTVLANDLGNERWADLLLEYGSMAKKVVGGYGGRVVDQIGDGLMAEFEGPVNAIRAAKRLRTTAAEIGISVRSGIHIGEVVERDGAPPRHRRPRRRQGDGERHRRRHPRLANHEGHLRRIRSPVRRERRARTEGSRRNLASLRD